MQGLDSYLQPYFPKMSWSGYHLIKCHCAYHDMHTCSLPVLACVYNSHDQCGVKSICISFDWLWASYGHGRSRVLLELHKWASFFLPSTNSILHLSTATKSSRSLRRLDSLFCLIFSFIFIFLPQNLLLPRGFHTNSVTMSEKSSFSKYIVRSYPDDRKLVWTSILNES